MNPTEPGKPVIDYPCRWSYKLIGHDAEQVARAAADCLQRVLGADAAARDHALERSRSSAEGRFHSYNLTIRVDSEDERLGLFRAFGDDPAILIVI